jgi:hypothetical protein
MMVPMTSARSRIAFAAAVVIVLAQVGCGSSTPVPPAPPPAQPTLPPVKETIIVKETVVVKETVIVQPTSAPTVTPTATATPTPTKAPVVAPAATKAPAQGGKLDFTLDDIEYASNKRKGDNKIQLTITLRPKGGVPPFNFVLDPDAPDAKTKVQTKVNGLTFTFDWHNCNEPATHSIILYSADGQKVGPVSFLFGYPCE